jgi:hypothetical protein
MLNGQCTALPVKQIALIDGSLCWFSRGYSRSRSATYLAADFAIDKPQRHVTRFHGCFPRHNGFAMRIGHARKAALKRRFGMQCAHQPRQRIKALLPLLCAPCQKARVQHHGGRGKSNFSLATSGPKRLAKPFGQVVCALLMRCGKV